MSKWWWMLCKYCGVTIEQHEGEWVDAYGMTICKEAPDGLHDVEETT